VRAETTADSLEHGAKSYRSFARLDFDADGREEIELTSSKFAAVVKPSDGGTLPILDFRPTAVTLINSLQRRVEAYHSKLENAAQFAAKVASIHDQTLTKELGLEKKLKYDRWARNSFRLLLFDPGKTFADYDALRLEETAVFAGGDFQVTRASAQEIQVNLKAPLRHVIASAGPDCVLDVTKVLRFEDRPHGFDVLCRFDFVLKESQGPGDSGMGPAKFTAGLESVVNFLAPNVPDRFVEFASERKPLEWGGAIEGGHVRFADEWQDVAVAIEGSGASQTWVSPIETVSESEEGFERVYQGSQILSVWNLSLSPAEPFHAETVWHVSRAREK